MVGYCDVEYFARSEGYGILLQFLHQQPINLSSTIDYDAATR